MANKPAPTRTTGPLHFEDLGAAPLVEFVARLIYDLRPWRKLEATGGSGSDEGFDARGFEVTTGASAPGDSEEDAGRRGRTCRIGFG